MSNVMVLRAGTAIGRELIGKWAEQGMGTVAFSGSERKLARMKEDYAMIPAFRTVTGNARNSEELTRAAEGVDVIVYGAYLTYDDDPETVERIALAVKETAGRIGAKVVRIEGIYRPLEESSYGEAPSQMRVLVPELYGATVKNTFVYHVLKQIAQAKPVDLLGRSDVQREYLYVADAAGRVIDLASRASAYGKTWNLGGGESISTERFASIAGETLGIKPLLQTIGGWKLRLLHGYSRRASEMIAGYDREFPEDSGYAFTSYDGTEPVTPYETGIAVTVRALAKKFGG